MASSRVVRVRPIEDGTAAVLRTGIEHLQVDLEVTPAVEVEVEEAAASPRLPALTGPTSRS